MVCRVVESLALLRLRQLSVVLLQRTQTCGMDLAVIYISAYPQRLPGGSGVLPGWAIAVTEPRAEAKAVSNVTKLGYQTFYPKIIIRVRRHGQRTQIVRALFPGYFFTWIESCWTGILGAQGIAGLLMRNNEIATVRETTMQELKDRCNANGIYLDPVKPPQFQIGQRVKVSAGVLADKIGIFDGTAGQHDAVLIDLLGGPTRVLVKEGTLVAV